MDLMVRHVGLAVRLQGFAAPEAPGGEPGEPGGFAGKAPTATPGAGAVV